MRVGVLGTGNMGKALIGGLIKAYGGTVSIVAYDQYESALSDLPASVNISLPSTWFAAGNEPDAVIIALKPADVKKAFELFASVPDSLCCKPLWISIAAGLNIQSIEKQLPAGARICRVMPNTPAMIGEGMSAFSLNTKSIVSDNEIVESIFNACGKVVAVPEKLMDAVTGLSGSGPAYVFLFIESLIEGGVTAGLPYAIARQCAVQTVIGAAEMVMQTGENPSVLKSKVMSPAGTTAAGLLSLEKNAFKHAVISAVVDAAKRSEQLGS